MVKSHFASTHARVFSAVLLLTGVLLAACGNSDDDAGPAGGGEDAGSGGACGPALTCDDFSGSSALGPFTAGSTANALPADFPAAPASATLCGAVTYASGDGMAAIVYYLNDGSDADLTAYYRSALSAAGYTVGAAAPVAVSSRPCDSSASITGGSESLTFSNLYIYGNQGGFAVGPFPVQP